MSASPIRYHNRRLDPWIRDRYSPADLQGLVAFLRREGTFHFPALPSGLFPAAHVPHDHVSGYASVWIRDNAHVAHALLVDGRPEAAARTVAGMAAFLRTQTLRIAEVLAGRRDPHDVMNRPHIRFDGRTVAEIEEKWAHAQNDALGYFLWIAAKLVAAGSLPLTDDLQSTLAAVVLFLERIEFWQDEDSGHWEESRKAAASSIGTATSGLAEIGKLLAVAGGPAALHFESNAVDPARIDRLVRRGREALAAHLPHECRHADPAKAREADAALLFLIYPLEAVDDAIADEIIAMVERDLAGEIGIRRYRGDSYWCADYKRKVKAEQRSADFSDDLSGRDALLVEGQEAQWCLFDPILSAAYGRRYQRTGKPEFLARQTYYLNRSLGHLTGDDSPFGGMRCPESYYLEEGRYVPVDQTPLLWTQGNLLVALRMMEASLATTPK
jgi:phosphorylase kinase alpha/beta subunit